MSEIHLLESVESTNERAKSQADEAEDGTCWVANCQIKGRGRTHRGEGQSHWFSPPNRNIYLSVLSRLDVEPSEAASLTLAVGAEICEKLRKWTGLDIGLKWPNDLYLVDQKLGGILTEGIFGTDQLETVVVGLGLNVNVTRDELPDELDSRATSLRIVSGQIFDRLALVFEIKEAIDSALNRLESRGLSEFIEQIRRLDVTAGRRIRGFDSGQIFEGTARGIADDGTLRVDVGGETRRVASGDVEFIKE